jgi:hypothetical protein
MRVSPEGNGMSDEQPMLVIDDLEAAIAFHADPGGV